MKDNDLNHPNLYDPHWNSEKIIPERVVIETIFGCNAKCGMCIIDMPTDRKKGIMGMDGYKKIVDGLAPYHDRVKMFDLFGLGEPLLDPMIFDRINYARGKGFRGLSFSTNAHLLEAEKQKKLLDTGIETIIFSIDGINKETHEAVRQRTDFDRVLKNCIDTIKMRDEGGYKTRFVVRFIRQEINYDQWPEYKAFWEAQTSPDKRDIVTCYDVHNWSGVVEEKKNIAATQQQEIDKEPCHHIFEKLVILANGAVALCFEDILDAQFKFGNAFEEDPVEIFNNTSFNKIRKLHMAGKRCNLKICGECSVLYNERTRE